MIVVPKDAPGVSIARTPHVFGYDHTGGHPEIVYEDVVVPAGNLLGEEGGGFAIAQARLGPGRIHHCMRTIGAAERALELMIDRALARSTFGSLVAEKGLIQDWIAESRIDIDMARQYVLHTAHLMDTVGNKAAATDIAGIKVAMPNIALRVIDRAIQVHGAAGVSQFTPLGGDVRPRAHVAHRRRSRRGAQDDDRPPRDPPTGPGDPAVAVTAYPPPVMRSTGCGSASSRPTA